MCYEFARSLRSRLWRALVWLPLVSVLALAVQADAAGVLYYADIFNPDFESGAIKRINSDGSGDQPLVTVGGGLRAIAVDVLASKLYWADVNNFVIGRADLDGGNQQNIITSGLEFPAALAVDPVGAFLYWGDQSSNDIHRSGLDGSDPIVLIPSTTFHRGLALDLMTSEVYWSTSPAPQSGSIVKADLGGFNIQTVVPNLGNGFKPSRIALDLASAKVYWTDSAADSVRRGNLDGTDIETLFHDSNGLEPRGLAVDPAEGKVYWGQDNDPEAPFGEILRMNLDGSFIELVLPFTGLVHDLVFVPAATLPVTIVDANPPLDNPYVDATQPFVDVLDTGDGAGLTHGIGASGTPSEGTISYSPIIVVFSGVPDPAPAIDNIVVTCTGGITPCPTVASVDPFFGPNTFAIVLSNPIPPAGCTTFTFAGAEPGQALRYQSLPGDVSMNGTVNTQDLLALIQALNNGEANLLTNAPRYDVNRSSEIGGNAVNTQDLLRLIQLLNGTLTTQAFNGVTLAACP